MAMQRSPTFLVKGAQQKENLKDMHKREDHVETSYDKKRTGVPLCFNGATYQKTHPAKVRLGYKDADRTCVSPMLVGVCDGVSQLEEFGMDPSELPDHLMQACEEFAMNQLIPDESPLDIYRGPVNLLSDAYEHTDSLGSTTVLICVLDNMSKIHGKIHSMIAVLSIGDCELLLLRRNPNPNSTREYDSIFRTEMQRIDGDTQTPLQVARVDERIDAGFDDEMALEVIREGSAVHCLTAYEGDLVVLGSDGVFDNLFVKEITRIVNNNLPAPAMGSKFTPLQKDILQDICQQIVYASHEKSGEDGRGHMRNPTPIGPGGKVDDTSIVVAEVVEWTDAHKKWVKDKKQTKKLKAFLTCLGGQKAVDCWFPPQLHQSPSTIEEEDEDDEEESEEYTDSEEEEDHPGFFSRCSVM